jgi:hypothetical protein
MLQESGRLQWDDHVRAAPAVAGDRMPGYRPSCVLMTCRVIAAGWHVQRGPAVVGHPYSPQQVLQRAQHLPLKNRFRAEYGYSNLMFLAAGEVIHAASGQTWQQFIRERILQPLQMQRTVLSVRDLPGLGNAARPHKTTLTGNQLD